MSSPVAAHRIIIYRETVAILAGMEEKQSFNFHKDLLAVHSRYFSNLFSEDGLGADEKISIPANASLFFDFISWVHFTSPPSPPIFIDCHSPFFDGL